MNTLFKKFFYLALALPLGIFYFVVIITGLSLGAGLFVITLGIPIFSAVFGFAAVFSKFERALANNFLGANIPPLPNIESRPGIWANFKAKFLNGTNWLRLFYLLAKLPLGIATFTIEITLFTVSLFLILTPLLYKQSWYHYIGIDFWHVSSLSHSLLATLAGIVLAIIFYYISQGLASASAEFARSALSNE